MAKTWTRIAFVTIGTATGGFVTGLGYVAAQSKFNAKTVSYTQLLDVGHQQFTALHTFQWVLFPLLILFGLMQHRGIKVMVSIIGALFLAQMLAVMPGLEDRMVRQIAGEKLPPSSLHIVYVGLSAAMMLMLLGTVIWAQMPEKRE